MFFCNQCNFMFNITKDVKSKQIGGKINKAITNLFNKYYTGESLEEDDYKNITIQDIKNDSRYDEDMNVKNQQKFRSWLKSQNPSFIANINAPQTGGSNEAYFICKSCQNTKLIDPGTIIYSKNYSTNSSIDTEDYTYAIYDSTLPRTRNYICKNKNCKSHTDDKLKEAVITKNNMDQIVYVCVACSKYWSGFA